MSRRGFTLVELAVVVLIMSIIAIYVGYSLSANERSYQAVDQTTQSQQDLRAILDMMQRDVREAALMMPEAASACGVDNTNAPDVLYLSDGSAIDPGNDTSEYEGVKITAGLPGGASTTVTLSSLVVEPAPPVRAAIDTDGDGTNDSDFRPGGGAIFFDITNPDKGVACGHIDGVDAALHQITVSWTAFWDGAVPALSNIRVVPANEYRVVGTDLQWNGIVLASDIEDLQVAWIFDPNGNDIVDAGEVYGDQGGKLYDSSSDTLHTNYEDAKDLRELEIGLVSRSRLEDAHFTRGMPQALENRNPAGFVNDGYRRRVLVSRVSLRNLGMRG